MDERFSIPSVFLEERKVNVLFQVHGLHASMCGKCLEKFGISNLPDAGKSESGEDFQLLWNGPGMWFIQSEHRSRGETLKDLRAIFTDTDATVTDLSSARAIVRVSGRSRYSFLKKGCPVDIDAMREGEVVSSVIGHLSATIHCLENSFDVYVLQSFGEDFWDWCRVSVREFNL